MKTIIISFMLFFSIHLAFSQIQNEEEICCKREPTVYSYCTKDSNYVSNETTNIDSLLTFKDKISSLWIGVYDKFSPKVYEFINLDTLTIAYGGGKLPQGIRKLKKLKYLELYSLGYKELPNDTQYLDSLIIIKIIKDGDEPRIFTFPSYFAKMKSLQYLDFFETDLKFYNTTTIFKNINRMRITFTESKQFPIRLSQFPNLTGLGISCDDGEGYKWKIPKQELLKMPYLNYIDISTDNESFMFEK